MGNTIACCVSPERSPKLPRQLADRLEDYQKSTNVRDDTGPYLQHISDREEPNGRCHARIFGISCCSRDTKGIIF